MLAASRHLVLPVLHQHAEESAILRSIRSVVGGAPHAKLRHLRRFDDRIAAHLDGLAVAGEYGTQLCRAALATPGAGEVFTAVVRAIEDRDVAGLDRHFALAAAEPQAQRGLLSAFGWVSSESLRGIVRQLLSSPAPLRRKIGIAACAMHRVDPGGMLDDALDDPDGPLRARALRVVGELGRVDILGSVVGKLGDEDEGCRFWSAWSSVLLGERGAGLEALCGAWRLPEPLRTRGLRLALAALGQSRAHGLLKDLARDGGELRSLIQGAGFAGDAQYIPWLIKQMDDPRLARLAGEAFSLVTGADLFEPGLEGRPPEGVDFGPTDNPDDEDVSMDPDDGLPWPDPPRISAWWSANSARFPAGARYFMGAPVTRQHGLHVLREGYQRQRAAAAEWLCLLDPGTKLFPTRAPAWRQARWLAGME